ncbi:hypothetical protein KQ940_21790, partial [Marinobacterium sp. D7]|uniref:hypothetical protein n=1 Tax=Marinobacterium ramblicola TaxID=2849041 RepID=UPI001C2DE3C8
MDMVASIEFVLMLSIQGVVPGRGRYAPPRPWSLYYDICHGMAGRGLERNDRQHLNIGIGIVVAL